MKDSMFYSAFRALFVAFGTMIGIAFGLVALLLIVGLLSGTSTESKLKTHNEQEIMPNADGKRETHITEVPVILQVDIDGVIGIDNLTMQAVRQELIESREDDFKGDRVKGVLVYINTPGGTVVDADGIYRALKEYKEKYKVPVYAFVDGICASGGMYVAAAADKIFATDVSLVGSVGVIVPTFMNFTKLLDKIGVDTVTLSAGKDKDAMNPFRPWKPGEEKNYQNLIDYFYGHFVNILTTNRPAMSPEKLVAEYGAHIFDANSAKEKGFIDESNASLTSALKELLAKANIEDDKYQVVRLKKKDWFSSLFSSTSPLWTGKITHQFKVADELDPALQNQFLYLYRP